MRKFLVAALRCVRWLVYIVLGYSYPVFMRNRALMWGLFLVAFFGMSTAWAGECFGTRSVPKESGDFEIQKTAGDETGAVSVFKKSMKSKAWLQIPSVPCGKAGEFVEFRGGRVFLRESSLCSKKICVIQLETKNKIDVGDGGSMSVSPRGDTVIFDQGNDLMVWDWNTKSPRKIYTYQPKTAEDESWFDFHGWSLDQRYFYFARGEAGDVSGPLQVVQNLSKVIQTSQVLSDAVESLLIRDEALWVESDYPKYVSFSVDPGSHDRAKFKKKADARDTVLRVTDLITGKSFVLDRSKGGPFEPEWKAGVLRYTALGRRIEVSLAALRAKLK